MIYQHIQLITVCFIVQLIILVGTLLVSLEEDAGPDQGGDGVDEEHLGIRLHLQDLLALQVRDEDVVLLLVRLYVQFLAYDEEWHLLQVVIPELLTRLYYVHQLLLQLVLWYVLLLLQAKLLLLPGYISVEEEVKKSAQAVSSEQVESGRDTQFSEMSKHLVELITHECIPHIVRGHTLVDEGVHHYNQHWQLLIVVSHAVHWQLCARTVYIEVSLSS